MHRQSEMIQKQNVSYSGSVMLLKRIDDLMDQLETAVSQNQNLKVIDSLKGIGANYRPGIQFECAITALSLTTPVAKLKTNHYRRTAVYFIDQRPWTSTQFRNCVKVVWRLITQVSSTDIRNGQAKDSTRA